MHRGIGNQSGKSAESVLKKKRTAAVGRICKQEAQLSPSDRAMRLVSSWLE